MFFDTLIYLLFLTFVVVVYWRLGWRRQNAFLLVASYFFYGWWDWRFLSLILLSTTVDFLCAHYIESVSDETQRKFALFISVTLNLGFLGFFKYCNFFVDSFSRVLEVVGVSVPSPILEILLPPGISFYTFQALAYIVDVYFRRLKPAQSFIDYALFISLFPHLIAGPIQRPSHLLPQVQAARSYDSERFFNGLTLIITGLFRKCVIADNCALLADGAFGGKLGEPNLFVLALAAYSFAWQIYGDFSGYSNIARGSAQLLGFHFMVNFRQPYLAVSLQDFWRRWHISLSTWLRDYLYIPLGGNRGGEWRTFRNLFATMTIGGGWHGANWTFIVWGMLHGWGLGLERLASRTSQIGICIQEWLRSWSRNNPCFQTWLQRIVIFHAVCIGWVFFRAESVGQAWHFLYFGVTRMHWIPEYATAAVFLVMFTLPMFVIDLINERRGEEYLFERAHPYSRAVIGGLFILVTLLFAGSKSNAFIYFQF